MTEVLFDNVCANRPKNVDKEKMAALLMFSAITRKLNI